MLHYKQEMSTRNTNNFKMNDGMYTKKNREIEKFPHAFSPNCTIYTNREFSERTKHICCRNKDLYCVCFKICKIIVLGDVCVGKTSIVNRFCTNIFDSNYKSTIGVDFQVERFNILGIPFNLQIWDTAGQERFRSIAQSYYRGAHAIVIVFDLSSIKTLANCKNWLKEAKNASSSNDPFIFYVGTKKDLLSPQAYENVLVLAEETSKCLGGEFWAVSSKTGENIDDLFARIAALCFNDCIIKNAKNIEERSIKIGLKLDSDKCKKKQKCQRCDF